MEFKRGKPRLESSVQPPHPIELSLVADFKRPWQSTRDEVEAIAEDKGRWHPSSLDFDAVARTPNAGRPGATIVMDVNNLDLFVGAIVKKGRGPQVRANRTVGRVNLITHGGKGCFALSGTLHTDGRCILGGTASEPREEKTIDERTLEWFNTDDTGRIYRDMIRNVLTEDAELWLILCKGHEIGPSNILSQEFANTFGSVVRAYNEEIRYWPDYDVLKASIKCPPHAKACVNGRNLTSIGGKKEKRKDGENFGAAKTGRGYFCRAKVPKEFAGEHLKCEDPPIRPTRVYE